MTPSFEDVKLVGLAQGRVAMFNRAVILSCCTRCDTGCFTSVLPSNWVSNHFTVHHMKETSVLFSF
jgi:hypothetical protein